MPEIDSAVGVLEQVGFFQYVLPFILMFAVYYGVLRKAQVFDRENVNGTIAFVAAAFTLYYAYQVKILQEFFSSFMASAGIVMLFILLAGIISIFLFNILDALKVESKLLRVLLFLGIFLFIHRMAIDSGIADTLPGGGRLLIGDDTVAGLFVVILVIYGVSWLAGEGPSTGGQGA